MCDGKNEAVNCFDATLQGVKLQYVGSYTPPHELLSYMIEQDLGVKVNAQALRMFVRSRWDKIKKHGHAIHEGR